MTSCWYTSRSEILPAQVDVKSRTQVAHHTYSLQMIVSSFCFSKQTFFAAYRRGKMSVNNFSDPVMFFPSRHTPTVLVACLPRKATIALIACAVPQTT